MHPQWNVNIRWAPYIIDPNTADGGEDYLAYNERRWGSDGWTHDLRRSAKQDQLQFKDWKWWPATLQAHRLILFAEAQRGIQCAAALKAVLFRMCYEEGTNISKTEVLAAAADEIGLAGAQEFLAGNEMRQAVIEQDMAAKRELRINGVPHFRIRCDASAKSVSLGGAQPARAFLQAFQQIMPPG